MEQFCRSAFCEKCWDADRPKKGNFYVLYQGTQQQFVYGKIDYLSRRNSPRGFSPHLFRLLRAQNDEVEYTKVCLIHLCGIAIIPGEDDTFTVDLLREELGLMSVKDWNALVLRFHGWTGYEL